MIEEVNPPVPKASSFLTTLNPHLPNKKEAEEESQVVTLIEIYGDQPRS